METSLPAESEPVESPADTGRDAPTARPPEPAESPKPAVESPAAIGRDAPTARPPEPVESPKSEGDSPADTGRDAPTARPSGRFMETSLPAASEPIENPADSATDVPKDDESLLGELFDLVACKRAKHSDELSSDRHDDKDESPVKISLPQPAPSWDDAPLEEEGDFWQKLYNLDKWKYWKVGAALAGLCLLSVIVFAVVAKLHSKPEEAEPSVVSQTTEVSEPQSEPASPIPTPTPTPTPTLNSNSQPSTPSASDDGRTVYTANLIPPPDSYVD